MAIYKIIFLTLIFIILFISSSNSYSNSADYIITSSDVSPELISQPSYLDSIILENEIQQIIKIQKSATKEEISQAKLEHEMKYSLLTDVINKSFLEKYPQTNVLLDMVFKNCKHITGNFKDFYNTKRPYLMDSRIKSLVLFPNISGAYPSGHTSSAYLIAYILSDLFPESKNDLLNKANSIASHRILLGMHFPSDIEGGKNLAKILYDKLKSSEKYKKEFLKVKNEIENSK